MLYSGGKFPQWTLLLQQQILYLQFWLDDQISMEEGTMASLCAHIQQLHLAVSMPEKLKEIKLSCIPKDARVKISDLFLDHSK